VSASSPGKSADKLKAKHCSGSATKRSKRASGVEFSRPGRKPTVKEATRELAKKQLWSDDDSWYDAIIDPLELHKPKCHRVKKNGSKDFIWIGD
jgi:hypothetical protein